MFEPSGFRFTSKLRLIGGSAERTGRATAPVGLVSGVRPVFAIGVPTGSRPLNTRLRRSSLSKGTPGVRVVAPVGLKVAVDAGRAMRLSPLLLPAPPVGRIGKSPRKGCASITRCAMSPLAARPRPLPKSRAGIVFKARRYAGLMRRRLASSFPRSGLKRSRS